MDRHALPLARKPLDAQYDNLEYVWEFLKPPMTLFVELLFKLLSTMSTL
jgi:hypothetical protein